MTYRIILNCDNSKDGEKYDRDLHMNNFEAAQATVKSLVIAAYDNLIDGYTIEWWASNEIYYKVVKK
jgi:hypothetical protein